MLTLVLLHLADPSELEPTAPETTPMPQEDTTTGADLSASLAHLTGLTTVPEAPPADHPVQTLASR